MLLYRGMSVSMPVSYNNREHLDALQANLIRSHAAGTGDILNVVSGSYSQSEKVKVKVGE